MCIFIFNCKTHAQKWNCASTARSMRHEPERQVCGSASHVVDGVFYVSSGETKRWKHSLASYIVRRRFSMRWLATRSDVIKFTTPLRHSWRKSKSHNYRTKSLNCLLIVVYLMMKLLHGTPAAVAFHTAVPNLIHLVVQIYHDAASVMLCKIWR